MLALDTVATIGSIPPPETVGGQIVKVLLIVARRRVRSSTRWSR